MEQKEEHKTVWTIGHSTHTIDVFTDMLRSFRIQVLADIRRFPGSRRYPHFNAGVLEEALQKEGIAYTHFIDLGGRRQPKPDSINTAWRLPAFRGYADYMDSGAFKTAIARLEQTAAIQRTAYMCSEAPWWRCHRSLVSDYLKAEGWMVMHIMKAGKAETHPFTSAAAMVNGKLDYTNNSIRFE